MSSPHLMRLLVALLQGVLVLLVLQATPLAWPMMAKAEIPSILVGLLLLPLMLPARLLQSRTTLTAIIVANASLLVLSHPDPGQTVPLSLAFLMPVLTALIGLRGLHVVLAVGYVLIAYVVFSVRLKVPASEAWVVLPIILATALAFLGKTLLNEAELQRVVDANEKERHESMCDPVTGLPNRAHFIERVWKSLRHAKQNEQFLFAILFVDLDGFKPINDKLGHKAGDAVLVETAKRLQACLRRGDIVARYGGDEFTLLVNNISTKADVIRIAERLLAKVKEPIVIGQRVHVGASVGIAVSTNLHERPEDLIRDADLAMYQAKFKGKGQYAISDQIRDTKVTYRVSKESHA